MVICTYFQRGQCHFGSQCRNEHISQYAYNRNDKIGDIRLLVTAEAESALSGKQWILSCFAPFRDKLGIIIPGFTEDLSPEEVRWECYQAKAQGNLPQYTQALSTKIQDATQKMQMLKTPSAEVLNFLSELHNGAISTNTNNPFCTNHSTFGNTSTNVFGQTGTVFDKPQTNIFGGSSSNPFSSNFGQTNVFASQAQSTSNNVFTSSNANTNIFRQTSAFSNAGSSQGIAPNTNIFAKAASNFGQNQAPGPFSAIQQPSSNSFSFAVPQSTPSVFGGNSGFSQPVNLSNNNPLFGQPATLSGNIFASANSVLPSNSSAQQNSVFGNFQSFGGVAQSSSTFNTNTENCDFKTSLLENNQPNVFGMPNASQNIFGANVQIQDGGSTAIINTNVFQTPSSQYNVACNPFFNSNNFQNSVQNFSQTSELNKNVYSKLEELSQQELEAFQNDSFKLRSIPAHPPTLEMCQ